MRSAVVVAFGFFVLSAGSPQAVDSDFQIPETEMILALQAAVRADDKALVRCASALSRALLRQNIPHDPVEGVVLEPLCDDHGTRA